MPDEVDPIALALAPFIPAPFNALLAGLARVVMATPSPATTIERATFYAAADTAKLAADELLRRELGHK